MAQRSNLSDDTYYAILERISEGELVTDIVKDFSCTRADVWRKSEEIDPRGNGQTSVVSPSTYTRARIAQAHSMAEDTVLIADGTDVYSGVRMRAMVDSLAGVEDEDKQRILDSLQAVAVQRDKLRVDTRKWLTTKIAPRIYGEVKNVELTGAGGGPIAVEDVTQLRDTLTARLAGIASRRLLLTATARVVEDDAGTVDAEVVDSADVA